MSAEIESPPEGLDDRQRTGGAGRFLQDRRIVWLFLAAAAIHSFIPAKILLADWGGGKVPGIAILGLIVFAVVWLLVVWGLAAVGAMVRRTGVRAVILVLLLLPYPIELEALATGISSVPHLFDDPKTGRGYFDSQIDRDLAGAIWACGEQNDERVACDLDRIAALTAKTDTSKVTAHGTSLMWWAITYSNATNYPDPDVLRIVLRGGKPPQDVSEWLLDTACCDSSRLPLLRAVFDGGVDPNTRKKVGSQFGDPYLYDAFRWPEGVAAYLDAGFRVDEPDDRGYTPLMQAIQWHQYDVAALLVARGAAEDHVAPDGKTMEALVAAIPPDEAKLPPAVRALVDRHRPK